MPDQVVHSLKVGWRRWVVVVMIVGPCWLVCLMVWHLMSIKEKVSAMAMCILGCAKVTLAYQWLLV
jgi:hypothetical protein